MKKRIVAVTCVLMFCLGLIGCGTERADKTQQLIRGAAPGYNDGLIRVGMIQTGKESDWRDANTNDYLNTFTKERGYDLIYIDGNSSSERQVKAMYDLIQQKVDYIILQPIVETGWEDAIHAAKEAGIPVIVADRKIAVDETEYVSEVQIMHRSTIANTTDTRPESCNVAGSVFNRAGKGKRDNPHCPAGRN